MSTDVEIQDRTTEYDGYVHVENITLKHRLFSGGMGSAVRRDLVRVNEAVGIVPYDPVRDELVLIRQFRIGVWGAGASPWLVESVAGVIDEGEDPKETARRETLEETGCTVTDLHYVCEYFPSPGVITENIKLYCGITDTTNAGGVHGLAHEGEDIEAFVKPWAEAWQDLQSGRLHDAKLLLILMWLSQKRESLLTGSQTSEEPV